MKPAQYATLALIALSLCLPAICQAQNVYALGMSTDGITYSGTAMYAHDLTDGTKAFAVLDAIPTSARPFMVVTNISGGIAKKLLEFPLGPRTLTVWSPTAAGISWSQRNVGWAWTGGVLVDVPLTTRWGLQPNIRFVKSSVNNNEGYQLVGGILVRWK